ncbi:MAG: SUMF1/EgtB/PvdO family nonheme iron enzyme [Candidatus Krumholzibacteria bacterium]|nr:SUMF1/EgtB/PvdO family nonheme iron enzyme [Candidatus Krumholzibacteria bacterium]
MRFRVIMIVVFMLSALLAGCTSSGRVAEDLVFIEGGDFMMGNPYDSADPDESFIHRVHLDSYYFGKYEVSAGQFREFVEDTGYITTAERIGSAAVFIGKKVEKPGDGSWKKPYFPQHDGHPAVCVSWYDVVEYCNWRSSKEGLTPCYTVGADSVVTWDRSADGYRLATEAEWEYAGRSRGKGFPYLAFSWGGFRIARSFSK